MTNEQLDVFHKSLKRCLADDGFLERFYFLFMSSSPAIAEKFKKTNWLRQRRMLVGSFYMMMAAEEAEGDDAHLTSLAQLHGSERLNIPGPMYDKWLEALIEAVSEYDPVYNDDIEGVWRTMMSKGIKRMKQFAGKGATGQTIPRVSRVEEDRKG